MTQKSKKNKKNMAVFPSAKQDADYAAQIQGDLIAQDDSSFRLAYDDPDFLSRDEMRGVRLQLEFRKTELVLTDQNIENTIVIFGSARVSDAQEKYSRYYQEARNLAYAITKSSEQNDIPTMHVITGGGPGIMEAANRGAQEAGGVSIGLNIVLPYEQRPNPYITPGLSFQFHYFALRKMHLLLRSKALVVFPGGYGTLDELFETLTLIQTGKMKPFPILLFGKDYWEKLINFDFLIEEGMVDAKDKELFCFVDKAEEAWRIITDYLNHTNFE